MKKDFLRFSKLLKLEIKEKTNMAFKPNPLVSIIIPIYNAEEYIKETINSAIGQTYKNIEIIVIDDGSTDGTAQIVKSFSDPRIIYFYQENQGISISRNRGIEKSQGEFITFLDADDLYLPRKVERELVFLKNHPEFKIVYCNLRHFHDRKPEVLLKHKYKYYSGDIFKQLLVKPFINPNTIMISKEVFEKIGLYDEKMHHSEDWDVWLRISRAGFKFGFLDEDLVRVRIHKGSLSDLKNQWDMKEHALYLFNKLFNSMTPEEKKYYQSEKILKKLKFKLAIAYLSVGRKKDFFKTILSVPSNIFEYIFGYLLVFVVYLFPAFLLEYLITSLWQFKQKKLFQKICL